MVQDTELPFIKYPVLLGEDGAGTVISAGTSASTKYKPGDRILALITGSASGKSERGGFQEYVIVDSELCCHIPDSLSFAEASVFALPLATSAHGLFSKDWLALPYPKVDTEPNSTGKSVLIWGGSSALGSNAIQLAKFAGLEVFATSSKRNFDYTRSLGASKVFDYSSPTIVDDLVAELNRTDCAGIWQAAGEVKPCVQIAAKMKGNRFVAAATVVPEDIVPEGVRAKMLFGDASLYNEVAPGIYGSFLPDALRLGKYKVAPEPLIVGTKGLEGIQEGYDILRRGVSARKVVVLAE